MAGDFLAAFLLVHLRVVAADGGERGLGGFDGFQQSGAACGAGVDFHLQVFHFGAVGFAFFGRGGRSRRWAASMRWSKDSISVSRRIETSRSSDRRASIGFCCSSADCLARRSTASSVRSSLSGFDDVLLAADDGFRLGLQAAGFVFERFQALAGGGEFAFHVLAAFGGGAFAVFEFAALPA